MNMLASTNVIESGFMSSARAEAHLRRRVREPFKYDN
jgi:hypothetical protein